jgi:hypothetical protein
MTIIDTMDDPRLFGGEILAIVVDRIPVGGPG